MEEKITDERLREVYEGGAPFTVTELLTIVPEIAKEEHIQRLLAVTVTVRRLAGAEKRPTGSGAVHGPPEACREQEGDRCR